MIDEVYQPAEDTYLMEESLPKSLEAKKVLEIGCGTGFLSIKAALKGAAVTAADINENALDATERLAVLKGVQDKITLVESNLFDKINEKFDLILFNPPYVASNEIDKKLKGYKAWAGGKKGREVIDKFLNSFEKYLKKDGSCLLLVSSQNEIKKELEEEGWNEINKARLMDGEKLFVMEFVKK